MMAYRTRTIVALLALLGLPMLLVVAGAASSYGAVNRRSHTIVSSGETRQYLLYVPRSYDRGRAVPLVISLHGAMNWPEFQANLSGWNTAADEHGFIVVYPAGEGSGPKTWFMTGRRTPSRMPDVVFVSDLIDRLEADYNIDRRRIFVNGVSNGGGMAFALSCTLSDRIAAIGAVAAAETLPWTWCADSHPIPMVAFHGTADPIVPYNGGKVWLAPEPFPNVPAWAANWARRNRCDAAPTDMPFAADVTRREYTNCADNAAVVLYTLRGGGHTWPGGAPLPAWIAGPTSHTVDATGEMWAFFREHPLRNE
jgi:polyhydroxybutyrate depolymerase